ncbi:ATP-binding cassette domain-containing protein [Promethearchaeum syntrophicum]|uniref:ATP-binding cassette domain-containing protein n=1 Tax=Promethearchaeum syntrophicum TaxID=2594042 RepID=A0A5B9DBJ7_9ARCH|nr:ATP-binding cassette domain-containing protein [Candidatus Prometheoarchaeum syntrophicum]QEE16629.1 Trehalose/maltose import ATP-binding protein MalK [Candidatus Prometheoarchaeum syntrophicum]
MESSKIDEIIGNSNSLNSDTIPIIEFSNFSFRYEKQREFALKDINLSIFQGEIILLGGISGSGKSTLCNAISGRIPLTISGQMKGNLNLFEKNIWNYNQEEISRKISYVFQNTEEQLISFSVFDEIAFAAENLRLSQDEIRKRVKHIAEALGITELLNRSIYSLSSGEKQKTILAANLVMSPKILLLDEPLAFLDKKSEILLRNLLENLHKIDPSLTIIIIEHRLKPFYSLINRIFLLNQYGEMIFNGKTEDYEKYLKKGNIRYLRDDITLENVNVNNRNDHSNSKTPILKLENISYQYPNSKSMVFSNFSLDVNKGEFLGIVGNNGTGKTTLLYLIAHMLNPINGSMNFSGESYDLIKLYEFIPKMGFIFQNPENQLFGRTIKDEILFAPRNFIELNRRQHKLKGNFFQNIFSRKKKKPSKEDLNREENDIVERYLPLIGEHRKEFDVLRNKNPFSLSWGQKRRLNLASIFSYSPELLLVDEPFIGQDAASIDNIFKILNRFVEEGKTVLIVSHDKELLQNNCSRIIELETTNTKSSVDDEITKPPTTIKKIKKKKKKKKSSRKLPRINLFLNRLSSPSQSENWISKLNPVMKLTFLIIFTFLLFYQDSIIFLVIIYLLLLVIAKSANLSVSSILRQIRWLIMLTLIYIPLNTLFDANITQTDEVLFYFFSDNLPVRRLALYYSLRTGFLIIIFISTSIMFTKTTSPKDLVYSLIQIGIPYRYAFSFMIGLRYIPLIEQESNTIEIAQQLRGAYIRKGISIRKIYNHLIERITTLLISIIRKAKTTASTIEARGFGFFKRRTNLYQVKWSLIDTFGLVIFVFLCILIVLIQEGIIVWVFYLPSLYSIFLGFF